MNVNKSVNKQQPSIFLGKPYCFLSLTLSFCVSAATTAFGATNYTWDGGAGPANEKWSQGNNWGIPDSDNVSPPANNISGLTNTDVFFAGNIRLTPKVDQTYFIHSLSFNSGAGAFIVVPQNSEILRIGNGGIINNSANIQTLAISLSLSNSQTWNASAGGLNFSELVMLNANTLTSAGPFNTAISNTITGTGGLIQNGIAALNLAGLSANTFSGGLVINSGTVFAQKGNAFGSGLITVNNGVLDTAVHNQSVGAVTLAGGVINGSTGIITGSTYQVQSGAINARLGGTAAMTKSTSGTVTLTSSNIYSGNTVINGGKLVVNNVSGSGTGSGNVSINNSGILAGNGSIAGAVTNRSGGTISAGDANLIGQLNTGTQVWAGGGTNLWEIKDVDAGEGVGWDFLNIAGGLSLAATAGDKFVLDVHSLTLANAAGLVNDFDPSQNYVWTIARTVSGVTFGAGENETTVFQLLLGGFANSLNGGTFSIATGNSGKDLNLVFSPAAVPEPAAFTILALGLGVVIRRRRNSPR